MTKEALKLALEALTIQLENSNGEQKYADAIAEIKAMAQPVQPQRPWVGLTDVERHECTQFPFSEMNHRAIEAKLKELNA